MSALEEAAIVSLRVQARLPAYNYAKQLKALRFGTPFEAIRQLNDKKPEIVIQTPSHDMLGPNNYKAPTEAFKAHLQEQA